MFFQAVFADEFSDLAFRLARVQVMFGSCAAFRYSIPTDDRNSEGGKLTEMSSLNIGVNFFLFVFDSGNFSKTSILYLKTNQLG
jgi:hypothetical protein